MKGFPNCNIRSTPESLRRASVIAEENQDLGNRKWEKQVRDIKNYLATEHTYILRIGDTDTDKKCVMTGQKAKNENARLQKKFISDLDRKLQPRPRLHRWYLDQSEDVST